MMNEYEYALFEAWCVDGGIYKDDMVDYVEEFLELLRNSDAADRM